MINTQKGSKVGRTGSTIEIGKGVVDKSIKEQLDNIRDDFRGGHVIACYKCSERYKIMDSTEAFKVNAMFKTDGHCPMCDCVDSKIYQKDVMFEYMLGRVKIFILKLATWR